MKKLINMLLADDSFSIKSSDVLRKELETEMTKENPDINLINELVMAISEEENYPQTNSDVEIELKKFSELKKRKSVFSYIKGFVIAACAVIVVSNVISYSAYSENLYTLVTKKGDKVHFEFFKSDKIEKPSFKYDEYGIKEVFKNMGMKIEAPMYLPPRFEITEKRLSEHLVTLSNGEGQIDISFIELNRGLTVDGINPNESVIYVNGHIATYINDDNANWLIYKFDDYVAVYDFQNINDEEIQKIIESIE